MYLSKIRKSLFLSLFCLLSLNVLAQENLVTGFIVSLKGDTTHGLINYKNWRQNPKTIQFKASNQIESSTYTPQNISSFGVKSNNGTEIYKSAKVNIENSSDEIDKLDFERIFNESEEELFLLRTHIGAYDLYSYENQKLHFFIGKGNQITELKFKRYMLKTQNAIAKNEHYKTELISLLKDCASISENEINKMEYRGSAFIKLLTKYDECKGIKSGEVSSTEKIKLLFGIVAATDYSKLKIKNGAGRDATISSTGNFALGMSMAIRLPRNNGSSSFNIELLYRKYQFKNQSETIEGPDLSYTHNNKFEGSYLKNNIMYRYQFTLTKLKPFLNIGISQAFKLTDIDKTTTEKRFYSSISTYEDPFTSPERGYEQGINFGAGINVNKINIELRAETTNGFSSLQATKTSINSLYLNLNYIF